MSGDMNDLAAALHQDPNVLDFTDAWNTEHHTRFAAPPIRLNGLLARDPALSLRMTAGMLWDVEVRKAMDPVRYVPSVFSASRTFGAARERNGLETMWRVSEQRSWRSREPVQVIEHVSIDHLHRRVRFRGVRRVTDEHGDTVLATETQPLFLVEHGVQGEEDDPAISWRIVHLTERPEPALVAALSEVLTAERLPEYVSVYLRERFAGSRLQATASPQGPLETPAQAVAWQRPFGPQGPEMATVWGDAKLGAHGSLLRFAPGSNSGMHTHPFDSWGVVVEGELHHTYWGQPRGASMGPGSWYFEPAGVPHESVCGPASACVVLVFNPGPFGFVPKR